MRSLPFLLFASALTACATSDGTGDPIDQLTTPRHMAVSIEETTTAVHATVLRADGVHAGDASLRLGDGDLVVHVDRGPDDDDRLVIDELRLSYQDVVLPSEYFLDGQVLTGIVVRLEEPLSFRAVRTSDGALRGAGTADLRLEWKLRVGGESYGLAPQTLPGLALELVMSDQDGTLRADLAVVRHGVMWTWADTTVTLGDAELFAVAYGGAID